MANPAIIMAVAAPLIAWRMYSRIKRLTSRQPSRAWRHWMAAVLFPLLIVVLAFAAMGDTLSLGGLVLGVAGGAALGVLGLRHTVYENRGGGDLHFTPDSRIGVSVAALFIARVAYRFYEVFTGVDVNGAHFAHNPLNLLAFGVLAGYYSCYAAGLLRWRKRELAKEAA